ncbi:MAG: hypothetical protein HDR03_04475 [Lachnospiraceae bacterium]|nr:hypothetical protein [Lachnospiraceae bacterium]
MFKNIKILSSIYLLFICMLCLTGCGEDEALETYKADMETFFSNISEINDNMNSIDVSEDGYVAQILEYLDELDEEVTWMAELEVPEEFSAVESLADEASENMAQAVSYYHVAYEGEEYDANMEEAAHEYYDRANAMIQYIITILHGGIPEGEGITYTQEDKIFGSGYMNKTEDDDIEDNNTENGN